ncbi:MAG: beta strand repeat-containing protein [Clostridiaceae bacterium]
MKKGTKKTVSTLVATASILGVASPAVLAATDTAVITAMNAVIKAQKSLAIVDFNAAATLVNKLPASKDKTALTKSIQALSPKVITTEVKAAVAKINAITTNKYSVEYFLTNQADILAAINKVTVKANQDYLKISLTKFQKMVFTADTFEAYKAVVAAEAAQTQASVDAAQALVNKITNEVNKTYFNARLSKISVGFKVSSVVALNATQVKVIFNKTVDKTDAETLARYTLGVANPTAASLDTDKKTVTLTFATAEVTDAVLVVDPVKSETDSSVTTSKYTQVFTYKDEVKADILTVDSKTNGSVASTVTVKATEPIASALAKIDGNYVTANFGGTDTATITGLSLDKNTSHTIELINLTDKAATPNVTVSTSKTFNVVTDTVAPTVTLSTKSDKQILVTFDKSMDVSTVQAALAVDTGVKDEAFANVTHSAVAVVANTDNKQFTVDVTATLYTNSTTRTLTVVLPNTIKDSLGNAIATSTKQVVMTKDTVAPVATGYKVIKNASGQVTDLEVSFSEELAANANPAEPTIVDANGVVVTGTLLGGITANAITAGDKKVTYHFTTAAKVSGTFGFSFAADLVTDRAETGNKSSAFNYNVNFGTDTGTFDLTSVTSLANVITVNYGRAVKGGSVVGSATDLNNYSLAGKPLPAGTTITLDATQNIATITLGADGVTKTDAAAIITVANVKAITGEVINATTKTVAVTDNTKPVLTSAVLNTNGSITLGYSEDLTTPTVVGDYTFRLNGKIVADASVAGITAGVGSEAGKFIVSGFVATYDAGTGSAGDEKVFIDLTGDGLTADDIVLQSGTIANLAASNYASGVVGGKDAAISTITVATDASATGADAAGNVIKSGTTITVK